MMYNINFKISTKEKFIQAMSYANMFKNNS